MQVGLHCGSTTNILLPKPNISNWAMVFNGILFLNLLLFVESCNWNLKTMNRYVISSFDEEISWNITRKNGYCKLIINLPSKLILRSTQFYINLMQDRGLLLIISKEPIYIYIQTKIYTIHLKQIYITLYLDFRKLLNMIWRY